MNESWILQINFLCIVLCLKYFQRETFSILTPYHHYKYNIYFLIRSVGGDIAKSDRSQSCKREIKGSDVPRLKWKGNSAFQSREMAIIVHVNLHPNNMRVIENIISLSVVGATFPKPTDTSPVKQKYNAVL